MIDNELSGDPEPFAEKVPLTEEQLASMRKSDQAVRRLPDRAANLYIQASRGLDNLTALILMLNGKPRKSHEELHRLIEAAIDGDAAKHTRMIVDLHERIEKLSNFVKKQDVELAEAYTTIADLSPSDPMTEKEVDDAVKAAVNANGNM